MLRLIYREQVEAFLRERPESLRCCRTWKIWPSPCV